MTPQAQRHGAVADLQSWLGGRGLGGMAPRLLELGYDSLRQLLGIGHAEQEELLRELRAWKRSIVCCHGLELSLYGAFWRTVQLNVHVVGARRFGAG